MKVGELVAYQGYARYYIGKVGVIIHLFRLNWSSCSPELNAKSPPDTAIVWIGGLSGGRPSNHGEQCHPFALGELRKLA